MIRKLMASEILEQLRDVDRNIDRTKPIYANPVICSFFVCGAIRGIGFPVCSLASLSRVFSEDSFYILSQSLKDIDNADVLEVGGNVSFDDLTRIINSQFPEIFVGDLMVCWGRSQRWYIVFDAQLALGILLVRDQNDVAMAKDAYSEWDELYSLYDAYIECENYELRGLPENIRSNISSQFKCAWPLND